MVRWQSGYKHTGYRITPDRRRAVDVHVSSYSWKPLKFRYAYPTAVWSELYRPYTRDDSNADGRLREL